MSKRAARRILHWIGGILLTIAALTIGGLFVGGALAIIVAGVTMVVTGAPPSGPGWQLSVPDQTRVVGLCILWFAAFVLGLVLFMGFDDPEWRGY